LWWIQRIQWIRFLLNMAWVYFHLTAVTQQLVQLSAPAYRKNAQLARYKNIIQ
jgi:hypothetical protein